MQEMDLRFWEIHKLGPYLIVQSQYVLINKGALQVEQRRDSEKNKEGTLNYYRVYQTQSVSFKTTKINHSNNQLAFINITYATSQLLYHILKWEMCRLTFPKTKQ